jgi:hypothetical protein
MAPGPEIAVRLVEPGEPSRWEVTVTEAGSSTTHEVTLSDVEMGRLGTGYGTEQELVRACFEFLLAREPKEQILRRFDVTDISRYFPEFEREIRR